MMSCMMHDLIYRPGHVPLWRLSLDQVITNIYMSLSSSYKQQFCHLVLYTVFSQVYRLYRILGLISHVILKVDDDEVVWNLN